jgi:hypothetical protein
MLTADLFHPRPDPTPNRRTLEQLSVPELRWYLASIGGTENLYHRVDLVDTIRAYSTTNRKPTP